MLVRRMKSDAKKFLAGAIGIIGVIIFLALFIYPFQYGLLPSSGLASAFILFAIFETILNDTDSI